MKKILPIILSALILTSCSNGRINKNSNKSSNTIKVDSPVSKLTISDIFPFKENVELKYISNTNLNTDFYVDYIKDNKMQFRVVTNDSSTGYVVENQNGELKITGSKEDFFYHDDITSFKDANSEILLKEPLIKGTNWKLSNGFKRYISNDNVQIATSSGKYITIEVTTDTKDGKILDYYAPNIGLVKRITADKNNKRIDSLESIIQNAAFSQAVNMYYPSSENDSILFYNTKIPFKTNDNIKTYFEKYFKSPPSDKLARVFTPNVKINKLYLDTNEKKVYVDLSKEFEDEMNLGTSGEELVLKCITNTLCDYYNVDKLILTVDEMPYKSGHIIMNPNEALYMNNKNIDELK